MAGEDEFEGGNRDEEQIHYNPSSLSSDWPFNPSNDLANPSLSMINSSNPMNNTSCSSSSMIDPFWNHHNHHHNPTNSFMNLQNNATSSSNSLGFRKDNPFVPSRNLEMSWTPSNSAIKRGSVFLQPSSSTMLPHNLSQFASDSGFIERAARFSSFSAGNFDNIVNPYGNLPESSLSPYSSMPVQGQTQEGIIGNGEDCEVNDGSQPKNEAKQGGAGFSSDDVADEAEFSGGNGGGGPEENSNEGFGSKKRRRSGQDPEYDQVKGSPQTPNEATKNNIEVQAKGENNNNNNNNNANLVNNKSSGKHGKQVSQSSDGQKEEYIHVRARRGQATNSHSLAERVRREKISERMKFLQDLVPGCSKVTGKAVMLDEIINYVQSLQRQVEFLSMKLATVNPRMDFNIEGLLAKDLLESRAGPSGFGPDMTMPYASSMHLSQTGIMPAGISGVGSSSDAVRRTINSHLMAIGGVYKDPSSQVPSSWDDELHNIIQMGLNPSTPISSQNLGSTPPNHLKAEP